MKDSILSDNFYNTVDNFIQLLGADQVSKTDIFFRISRAANGSLVEHSEIQRVLSRIHNFYDWFDAWKVSADRYVSLGETAEKEGHLISAGEHYLRAGLLYHFAQLFTRPEDPNRRNGQQKRVLYYRKACPYLQPQIIPVEIPYQGMTLPGYLRVPNDTNQPGIIVMIPGANSVKEECHHWAQHFLNRGLATLIFDGPGQGERSLANGGVPLRLETFHHAVSAVLDYLKEERKEVDSNRIACWGQSTGGQLAMRAAAQDPRIKVVVSLSGGYDFRMEITSTTSADVWEEARDLYGFPSFSEAEAYIREKGSMQGIIDRVRCPLLLIHGARDNILAMEEIDLLQREAGGPVTVQVYGEGNHSVCNYDQEMSTRMADWMAEQLDACN